MNLPVIYVAGPFRGPTAWDIQQNVRRAESMALEVARLGAMPLTPHKNTEHFHGQLDDVFWLEGTLELLRRCDGIIVCEGWSGSKGTEGEVRCARARNMPIFFTLEQLRVWLAGWRLLQETR